MRRTAKGEMVDFDLIKAKQQMADKPAPKEVSVRQAIIDRRLRKKATAMTPSPINKTPTKTEPVVETKKEPVPETAEVKDVPVTDEQDGDVEEKEAEKSEEAPKPRRRQKTKPKQPSGDEDDTSNKTAT